MEEGEAMLIFIKLFEFVEEELRQYLRDRNEEEEYDFQEEEEYNLFRNQFTMLVNSNFNN